MKTNDDLYIRRCFELARKGIGKVSPNPLVGAVIVKSGKVLGEGYHERYGGNHAEINAIQNALKNNKDIAGATLYVNLEPCFHFGKTPPCVDAVIRYKISQVVIATKDPNPLVAGKSITKLRKRGIKCRINVLKKDALRLNEIFFKYISSGLPYVAIKAAQTSDGFIARQDGSSKWITNLQSRKYVHRLRNEYDAVIVGANTVIKDDPELTVRHSKGQNPVRVIIDGNFNVPVHRKIFNSDAQTIIYTSIQKSKNILEKIRFLEAQRIIVVQFPSKNGTLSMKKVLIDLSQRKIVSVLIEGGQKIYTAFLKKNLVDKIFLFTSKKKFNNGIKTFGQEVMKVKKQKKNTQSFGSDLLEEIYL